MIIIRVRTKVGMFIVLFTVMTNEEFFLDYTKEKYIKFASQPNIPIPPPLDPSSSTSEDPGNDNSHNNEDEV